MPMNDPTEQKAEGGERPPLGRPGLAAMGYIESLEADLQAAREETRRLREQRDLDREEFKLACEQIDKLTIERDEARGRVRQLEQRLELVHDATSRESFSDYALTGALDSLDSPAPDRAAE